MEPTSAAPHPIIPDRRRWYEIAAVVATGLGKFVFMDLLKWKLPFIVGLVTVAVFFIPW